MPKASDKEMLADFVGDMLFNKDNGLQKLLSELEGSERSKVAEFFKTVINWLKEHFGTKDQRLNAELQNIEKKLIKGLKEVTKADTKNKSTEKANSKSSDGVQHSVPNVTAEQDAEYRDYDKPITVEDIKLLREIIKAHNGERVSINDFTSKDIQKSQKWAYKFYKELDTRSPFFRAWFGDWRAYEDNPKTDAIITKYGYGEYLPINTDSRIIKNNDTGFDITVDDDIVGDSIHYASIYGDKKQINQVLGRIDEIVKYAILLDTQISDNNKNNKKGSTTFMHYLYAPITVNNAPFLVKLTVEEYGIGSDKRGYNIQRIKMSTLQTAQFSKMVRKSGQTGSSAMDGISVSQLYSLVKTYDKDFHAGKEVHPLLLNDDGTPRIFYHGTRDSFTVFDKNKRGSNTRTAISKNWFFAADKDTAKSYYPYGVMEYLFDKTGQEQYNPQKLPASRRGNLYGLYISAKNPLVMDIADYDYGAHRENADALVEFTEQSDKNGNDAIIFINALDNQLETSKRESTVVLFRESNQVKSATDNIGTFDGGNEDIRYSVPMVDNYTEEQYNNFGWASANDVVTASEREILLSRYADYKHSKDVYPITRFGEAVIHSYDLPDVIAYIKGSISNPEITKIVRINADDETAGEIKEDILHNDRRKIPFPYQNVIDLYGEEILTINQRKDYASFRKYSSRAERVGSEESNTDYRASRDGDGSFQSNNANDRADGLTSAFSMPESDGKRYSVPKKDFTAEYNNLKARYDAKEISEQEFLDETARLMDEANSVYGSIEKGENPMGDANYSEPIPKSVKKGTRMFLEKTNHYVVGDGDDSGKKL